MKNNSNKLNHSQLKLIDGIAFAENKIQVLNTEKKSEVFTRDQI